MDINATDVINTTATDDDPSQYLEDPTLFRDDLPRPFRMINKVLNMVLDSAWVVIEERRSLALRNACQQWAAQYDLASPIQIEGDVAFLAPSANDKYLYIATHLGGLACIDGVTHQLVAQWKPEIESSNGIGVLNMCVSLLEDNLNAVITLNSAGTIKLFLHLKEVILLAWTLQDIQLDAAQKYSILDVQLSQASDYFGLTLHSLAEPADQLTSAIVVWWTKSTNVLRYNLNKIAKDVEMVRPDAVWPMAHKIVSSAVDSISSLLAVALDGNNIVVHDLTRDLVRRIVHIDEVESVKGLFFRGRSSGGKSGSNLVVNAGDSGKLYLVDCQVHSQLPPTVIYCTVEYPDEIPDTVKPIMGISELFLVCRRDERLFFYDIEKRELITEFVLPGGRQTPLKPTFFSAVDSGRALLATIACDVELEQPTDGAVGQPTSRLFVYQLINCPSLKAYLSRQDSLENTVTNTTLQDRVDAAIRARMSVDDGRTERLNQRWFQMKEQLLLTT